VSSRFVRLRTGLRRGRWLAAAGLAVTLVVACEPSAPPGFTGSQPAASAPSGEPGSGAPGNSAPAGSALVPGKPVVTTDGGKVTVAGLGAGKSPEFELPAGSAGMTVSVCTSNKVIPFVTLYDTKGTKLAIVVEPTYTLTNLAAGSYYLDVAANPGCTWQIVISPG
jgi:hypothetical protein